MRAAPRPASVALSPALAKLTLTFKRSARRKTLGIKVRAHEVIVASPTAVPANEVIAWVNSQSAWILKHVNKPRAYPPAPASDAFTPQSVVFWRGEKTILAHAEAAGLAGIDVHFFNRPLAAQKQHLLQCCADAAAQDLPARLQRWQDKLGLYAHTLKLRPYKSCWGSCNQRGLVALNSLLMMAPSHVRDYVVIHELSHLKHMNHSAAFWQQVGYAMCQSDVRKAKQWLKVHGHQLLFIYR